MLKEFNNKFLKRYLLCNDVPMLKYYLIKGKDFKYNDFKNISSKLVIQLPVGSGGSKTFLCSDSNFAQIESLLQRDETYSISAYEENNIPYNIHCLIGKDQIEILPPSEQELEIIDKIEYIGSKYDIKLFPQVKNKLIEYTNNICIKLQRLRISWCFRN